MTGALSRAREGGEIAKTHDPAELAVALVDGFEGAISRARATGESDPLDVFVTVALTELTRRS